MQLFQYDHCPFCVRADMVARYKVSDYQRVYLLNDDAESCISRVGKKLVPILEAEGKAMGESLDIAKRLDEMGDPSRVVRAGGDAKRFTEVLDEVNFSINCLLFPRNIMIGLPEFETQSARDFFRTNKEQIIKMSFDEALAQTDIHIALVEKALQALPELEMPSGQADSISWDDILIFPTLRNLSMVKGLNFPDQVRAYLNDIVRVTGVELYFNRAV